MKKAFVSILLQLLLAFNILGQSIDYSAGGNLNHFNGLFPMHVAGAPFEAKNGVGFEAGIGFEGIKVDSSILPVRFTLNIINYSGSVYSASDDTLSAHISKYTLALGVYPVNLKFLKKRLHISLGVETAYLIFARVNGYFNTHEYDENNSLVYTHTVLKNGQRNIFSPLTAGLSGRIAWYIPFRNNWFITPQFLYYQGVDVELLHIAPNINSMRSVLEVGLTKRW